MKYVKIPEPLPIEFTDKDGHPQRGAYGLKEFLNEFVWVDVAWRNPLEPEWQLCALRLMEKFNNAEVGTFVELQDKDHEKLALRASLPDQKLSAQISPVILKLFSAISTAKDSTDN